MSVSNPQLYLDSFKSTMSDEQCARLMQIRTQNDFPIYEHIIFEFPDELIMESYERGVSIRNIIKERDIDYSQYIGTLRPYQRVGTAFMQENKHCMIGDGVGLGKTAEVAGLLNLLYMNKQLLRFVMAVETSAVGQTQIELMRFTGLKVVTLHSETPKMKKDIEKINWDDVDGVIIKHSSLKSNFFNNWIAGFIGSNGKNSLFNVFILDESSVIKSNTSQTHNYTENICHMMDRVVFMNATPFEKNLMDIYYQFDMMDDKLLPNEAFMKKNFMVWEKKFFWHTVYDPKTGKKKPEHAMRFNHNGYKNEQIFKDSLKLSYLGRSFKEVKMDVPHIYKIYTVQPNPDQQSALQKGYSYNELLNCPSLVPDAGLPFTRDKCPKLDRLCTLASNELNGMHFMVYCWHVEAQYAIKRELEALGLKCCVLNGSDPSGADKDIKKLEMIQAFNRGEYDVFITNAQKSLNLPGADALILYSATATVGRLEQIRGRIDRHVDSKQRLFIMLLYEGTGEFDLINEKARMRGEASRKLILDTETAIDYFLDSLNDTDENT